MRVELLHRISSQGSGRSNDDAAGHAVGADWVDFWIVDGATSVSDVQYVPGPDSDPQWYANFLCERFSSLAVAKLPLPEILARSIADARSSYETIVGRLSAVPVFAWPLAAASYVRVSRANDHFAVESCHLGDCSVFIRSEEHEALALWDPGCPEPPLTAPAAFAEQTNRLRQRRLEQHSTPMSGIAGFDPSAAKFATSASARIAGSFDIVLATDGLARLYKEYALITRSAFVDGATRPPGTDSLITALREAEQRGVGAAFYKGRDDATLLAARVS